MNLPIVYYIKQSTPERYKKNLRQNDGIHRQPKENHKCDPQNLYIIHNHS